MELRYHPSDMDVLKMIAALKPPPIRNYSQYDYLLVNRDVEASVDTLVSIVKATRRRCDRMEEQIRPILETFRDV